MKWRGSINILTLVFALVLVLAGCRADDLSSSSSDSDPGTGGAGDDDEFSVEIGDVFIFLEGAENAEPGELILYEVKIEEDGEGNEDVLLEVINVTTTEDFEQLLENAEIDQWPGLVAIQKPVRESTGGGSNTRNHWAIIEGDTIESSGLVDQGAVPNPFTTIAREIAIRDGLDRLLLQPERMTEINDDVRVSLVPGIDTTAELFTRMTAFDPDETYNFDEPSDLLALYARGLAYSASDDGESLASLIEQELLFVDAGSGVVDGRAKDGESMPVGYEPVRFKDTYASGFAQAIDDLESSPQGNAPEGRLQRFISRDTLSCDGQVDLAEYVGNDSELERFGVQGYSDSFDLYGGLELDPSSDALTVRDNGEGEEGAPTFELNNDERLFTCAGGSESPKLLRWVKDLSNADEDDVDEDRRDEFVLINKGSGLDPDSADGSGAYAASETGANIAVFGGANPNGGGDGDRPEDPEEPPPENGDDFVSCSIEGTRSFALNAEDPSTSSTGDNLLNRVTREDNAIDGDPETAAAMRLYLSLALTRVVLGVYTEEAPKGIEDADRLSVLVSVPERWLSVTVADGFTVRAYSDGEEVASNTDPRLVDLDLGGAFNDESLRQVNLDLSELEEGVAVDQLEISLRGVNVNKRIDVHDICYRVPDDN